MLTKAEHPSLLLSNKSSTFSRRALLVRFPLLPALLAGCAEERTSNIDPNLPRVSRDVSEDTFQRDVIDRSHLIHVLASFGAPWCGACRMLGPVLEDVARDNTDRFSLVKINTDRNKGLTERFEVRAIPDVRLFHRGSVVGGFVDSLSRPEVEAFVDRYIPREEGR